MRRRTLLKMGLFGTTAAVFAPRVALSSQNPANPFSSPLAGSIFHTVDSPGRWAGKEGLHVPAIERSGSTIEVVTSHEMDGFNHYIVKHTVLDENFGFVGETMFDPETDSPVSRHDIRDLRNVVYALSMCNKHDMWLNAFDL